MRKSKTSSGTTYNYYYHGDTVLNETKTTSGTTSNYATNIIGVTGIEARNQSGTTGFFGKDLHGDVRYAFNSSCTKIADYTYDAWGNDATSSTSTWAQNNPVRYNGQYIDEETGMYYLRARYYDPQMSRFTTEDPHWNISNMIYGDEPYTYTIEDNNVYNQHTEKNTNQMTTPDKLSILQANNVYSYCINNPINYYDYSGLKVYIVGRQVVAQMGWRLGFGKGIIFDELGNIGIVDEISFGGGLDPSASVGGYVAIIDAEKITDVRDGSFEVGGNVNPIKLGPISLGAGYEITIGLSDEKVEGKIYSVGLGIGALPADAHLQISYTMVHTPLIVTVARFIINKLEGE